MKKSLCCVLSLISTLVLFSTFGNAAEIDRPTVTKAFDVIEKYPEIISYGTLVSFKKKNTKFASDIVVQGVQARVFTLVDQENYPRPTAIQSNCSHYLTTVIPLRIGSDNQIILGKMTESWLSVSFSGKSAKEGRYYIVFEKSGLKNDYFRLRTADTKSYFDSGFIMIVKANEAVNIEKVQSSYEARRDSTVKLILDESSQNPPCYRYVRFAEIRELKEPIDEPLELCEAEKTTIYTNKLNP